jgi:HK97 family phage major capsid protein
MNKTIKTGVMRREYELRKEDVNQDARTVALTFSSEEPYDRWFGVEILDHSKKAVMLDRLNQGGPLLVGHNPDDHVGVVEEARVGSDRRGRAVVRLGKSARAQEIFQDVADGIRRNVSVGYRVHQMVLEKSDKTEAGEINTYRVTRWEPLEVSLVSVPADNSVGVGRASDLERDYDTEVIDPNAIETRAADPAPEIHPKETTPMTEQINIEEVQKKARDAEQKRIREITAYGEQFKCAPEAKKAVEDGLGVDEFRAQVLERMGKLKPVETNPEIGLTKKESGNFSFIRLIRHLANPGDARLRDQAGFELECSRAYADRIGRSPQGLWVPPDVLCRDLNVTDATGGYTIATNLLAQSFIDLLRNRMITINAGATVLSGLVGDVAIPRQSGGATAYWVADGSPVTESTQAFEQVSLQPRTVGGFTDITRKLMLQSSIDIEALVRRDLAAVLGLAVDLAALHGSGSGNQQPTGIAGTSGIGSVACGTNGGAPLYADIINLETEVAADNADIGTLAYVTNAKVRGKLKQTQKVATYGNDFIWEKGSAPGEGELNGYRALVSNQVSSTLEKGSSGAVCSAIFFGNWADLLLGFWSGVDILVDPYTASSSGIVRVVALQDVDVAVRHAESFAAILDATTT